MEKNDNFIEKAIYYSSAVFLLATLWQKIKRGDSVEEVQKILIGEGSKNDDSGE